MKRHPGLVVIFADDIGYGDFGCYGAAKVPTPHIDRIAAEGVRFTDAHSSSAVSTPSRYSLLTGRYCWRGALRSSVLYGYEPPLIERDRPTLASFLGRAGYATGCVGKWHLGLEYRAKPGEFVDFDRPLPWPNAARELEEKIDFAAGVGGGPVDLGFDWFYGTSGCPTCQPPYGFIEDRRFVTLPSEYRPKPPMAGRAGMSAPDWDHARADVVLADKAVEYIERQAGRDGPFFLYYAPSAAHEPCTPEVTPAVARGRSSAGSRGDLVWLFDWCCGRVYDALARTGRLDETILVVSSDNGALPGDRVPGEDPRGGPAYEDYGHRSCGDWRGYKSHIWEGGHRIPLVVRWPERVAAGSRSDALVDLLDLFATCADLTGRGVPEGSASDSVSFLPLLTGEREAVRDFAIHHSCHGVFSLRRGGWKAVFETKGSGGWPPPRGTGPVMGSPGQLYDLSADPAERDDLWDERPDVVRGLSDFLMRLKARGSRAVRAGES